MKIAVLVEGATELAFREKLNDFLRKREWPEPSRKPQIQFISQHGRIPKEGKLKRIVEDLTQNSKRAVDHVIALTDVYTGTREFTDAADARAKMASWVGKDLPFTACAAQHDFEAWLMPYWDVVQRMTGFNRTPPRNPESINHDSPPSKWLKDAFLHSGRRYLKPRDGAAILRKVDLAVSIEACPEFKRFVNAILTVSGASPIP